MSEAWKQWEGRLVDEKFPLRKYLGGSEHSAVFLTERGQLAARAAIKFIQVDEADAELQLERWTRAAQLSHPHVLKLFESGRCQLDNFSLLYVVTEYAEENLSQFLPQRPLTPAEARDVLEPVLEALTYLHSRGFVHGHLRPSNIFAIEDELKLSIDGVSPVVAAAEPRAAEPRNASPEETVDALPPTASGASLRHATPYDPPEAVEGTISRAGDIWALGTTLVEALTQRLPVSPIATSPSSRVPDPLVPETLPALFLDIVRHCLQRDPQRRWTVSDIAARLNPPAAPPVKPVVPASVTPRARASAAPPSKAPAYPVTQSPAPVRQPQAAAHRDHYTKPRYDIAPPRLKQPPLLPKLNYLALTGAAAVALILILVGAKLFSHHAPEAQSAAIEQTPAAPQKAAQPPARGKNQGKAAQKQQASAVTRTEKPNTQQATPQPVQNSTQVAASSKQTVSAQPVNTELKDKAPVAAPTSTTLRSDAAAADLPPSVAASNASAALAKGEVLEQVLPEPSPKAQATIRGKVRVRVKLHVDSSGNVTSADFDSVGPSRYFADLALQAARHWDFAPAKVEGHNVPSDWLVRFEFTQTATKAFPTQATP